MVDMNAALLHKYRLSKSTQWTAACTAPFRLNLFFLYLCHQHRRRAQNTSPTTETTVKLAPSSARLACWRAQSLCSVGQKMALCAGQRQLSGVVSQICLHYLVSNFDFLYVCSPTLRLVCQKLLVIGPCTIWRSSLHRQVFQPTLKAVAETVPCKPYATLYIQ